MTPAREVLRRLAQHGIVDDPEAAVRLSVGLEGFLTRWRRETLDFLAAGGSELRFVAGAYGRGKTHFLQVLEFHARREGFVTARVESDQKPFASLQDTYREIARAMVAPSADEEGERGLHVLLADLSARQTAAFRETSRGNPGFRNLVAAYARRARDGDDDDVVTEDLRALLIHDTTRRVTMGELYRQDRHLPRPLAKLGKRNAAAWLRSLLSLPRELGFKGLVVLFDETGADVQISKEPRRIQQQHLANLRNLVDHLATGGMPGAAVVYASTRDLIELARDQYPALWQRVARLNDDGEFSMPPDNPRAVWCRLDELTDPSPIEPAFFDALGDKLLELGFEAGLPRSQSSSVRQHIAEVGQRLSEDLGQGSVREFVKRISTQIRRLLP